ncbi:MAG: SRPBCC family protein [Schleiferiaceae bacterium]|nr:SRPBCC family protein [Schleiferiaceae bacterium]
MNTNIEGAKITLLKSQEEVFNFLKDPANFGKIMPDDVAKFEAGEDWFIFGLKGIPDVKLVVKETTPNSHIVLGAASSKLDFELHGDIAAESNDTCSVQLHFKGQFNPMLKMMVERPLKNFIGNLTDKLAKI